MGGKCVISTFVLQVVDTQPHTTTLFYFISYITTTVCYFGLNEPAPDFEFLFGFPWNGNKTYKRQAQNVMNK